jgi:hypothetical protein
LAPRLSDANRGPVPPAHGIGLATSFFFGGVEQHYDLSLTIILRRSKRTPVPKVAWEEKAAHSAALDSKKTARTAQQTALKPRLQSLEIGLIEVINYAKISLPIDPINAVFGVLCSIIFLMFAQLIATWFRREIE